jgi:pimeloyl-ACP methyl ester carboxylesterase
MSQPAEPLVLGAKQAVIAGHDVGASVAWQAALLRPDRFRGVIALGPPFRPRAFGGSAPPTTLMPRNENAVFYQLFLQTPEAEAALGRDLRRTFRSQFYSLSGDMSPSAGVFAAGMVPRKGFSLFMSQNSAAADSAAPWSSWRPSMGRK